MSVEKAGGVMGVLVADYISENYQTYVTERYNSVFRGEGVNEKLDRVPNSPILIAFLKDDDLQSITIASGNIGFVNTYEKVYKSRAAH